MLNGEKVAVSCYILRNI